MKILVCDDLPEKDQEFENAIQEANPPDIDIGRLFGDKLKQQLNTLFEGANAILGDCEVADNPLPTEFDSADLVILDNNLAHLGIEGARLTAEAIAGYIRAFSCTPYILSINKNPDVDFDLRYLIGDYTTRSDLAVNADHLSNLALWTQKRADAKSGFLPWYWPKLLDVAKDRRKKIQFVQARLDETVSDALGIGADNFDSLSRQARALLSLAEETKENEAGGGRPRGTTATFRDVFLASSRSLPNKEDRTILQDKAGQDIGNVDAIVARVVAADIDFWFRRDVLGPQEVLVDIPHLLMRMPFLLGESAGDIERWNTVVDAARNDRPFELDPKLFDKHLKKAAFEQKQWISSPCFWWPQLRENDELNARFSAGDTNWADAVFCEDRSEFLPLNPKNNASPPHEFVAQFEGSWNRRYVANMEDVRYVPKTRFAQ